MIDLPPLDPFDLLQFVAFALAAWWLWSQRSTRAQAALETLPKPVRAATEGDFSELSRKIADLDAELQRQRRSIEDVDVEQRKTREVMVRLEERMVSLFKIVERLSEASDRARATVAAS